MRNLVIAVLLVAAFSVAFVLVGITTAGANLGTDGPDSFSSPPESSCSVEPVQKPSCGCGCRLAVDECAAGGCPLNPQGCPA